MMMDTKQKDKGVLEFVFPYVKRVREKIFLFFFLIYASLFFGMPIYYVVIPLWIMGCSQSQNLELVLIVSAIFTLFLLFPLFLINKALWQLFGREVLTIEHDALTITQRLWCYRRSKNYALRSISDFYVYRTAGEMQFSIKEFFKGDKGREIAFDYGAKTYRVGRNLNRREAERIVEKIKTHVAEKGHQLGSEIAEIP